MITKNKKALTEEKEDHGKSQAAAQLESIKEMVAQLRWAEDDTHEGWNTESFENAERTIQEDALEVSVRSDWHAVGEEKEILAEYFILLAWGGPSARIVGELGGGCEPITARLEYQDWGTPWTEYRLTSEEEETLLSYARCFYFGE